jgi:hypothetical protein
MRFRDLTLRATVVLAVFIVGLSCAGKSRDDARADELALRYPVGSTRTMIIEEFGQPDASVQRGVDEVVDVTLEQAVAKREQALGKRVGRYDTYLLTRRADGDVGDLLLYDPQDRLIQAVRGIR